MRSIQILITLIVIALMGCSSVQARQAETEMEREEIEAELRDAREEMREAARRLAELSALLNDQQVGESIHHVIRHMRGPRLGIAISNSEDPVGVEVVDVFDDSAASQAGLQAGDIITAANNRPLDSGDGPLRVLGEVIRSHGSDQPLQLEILRDGEAMTVEARLPDVPPAPRPPRIHVEMERMHENMPEPPMAPDAEAIRERVRHMIGGLGALGPVRLASMNEGLATYFGTSDGMLVLSVPDDDSTQLRSGDVIVSINGEPVRDMHDVIRLLREHGRADDEPINVEVLREGNRQTLNITPDNGPMAWLGRY